LKTILIIYLSLLLCSCAGKDRETDQQNQRITRLEQRMDSLAGGRNNSSGYNSNISSGDVLVNGRCQAITKKGTQCKRKGKKDGYCYQHRG
jgi:hypothetical protein